MKIQKNLSLIFHNVNILKNNGWFHCIRLIPITQSSMNTSYILITFEQTRICVYTRYVQCTQSMDDGKDTHTHTHHISFYHWNRRKTIFWAKLIETAWRRHTRFYSIHQHELMFAMIKVGNKWNIIQIVVDKKCC